MSGRERIDTLIEGWYVVTMNPTRDIIRHGAVAVRGSEIVAVGKASDLEAAYEAAETVGGDRFVVTPGLVNTHIHITGEPLTKGYVPDDTPFEENVFMWLCPLYSVYIPEEERLSAQLAAVEMLKSGTTTFLEAGTIRFTDEVMDGLVEAGIRGRIGRWAWDLPPEPDVYRQSTDAAIANINDTIDRYRGTAGGRLEAWSMVVGHTTCSDPLWRGAREAADHHGVGLNFHMSPAKLDPDGFIAEFGQRPMIHLGELGVLGADTSMTHCVHVDDSELDVMAEAGCSVEHCPTTALKVSYGVTQIGKMPEMVMRGINVSIGIDGNNASKLCRHVPGHLPGGRAVQGRPHGPPDVPGREGLRDGHPGRGPNHAHVRRDRLAGARQEGRRGAARHRPARVAPAAQRDEPARVVCRRPGRAHRVRGRCQGGGCRQDDHHRRGHVL